MSTTEMTENENKSAGEEQEAGEETAENSSPEAEPAGDDTPEASEAEEVASESDAPQNSKQDDRPPTYEELESDVAALKDQLLRAMAEQENVRRRTEREKAEASKYAVTNFARAILSVADNLNRALDSVSQEARDANEDLNNLFVGIDLTGNELESVFEQFGIKSIDALGKKFDHNFHQAMFEVEDPDQPAGLVVQQVQKGYMIQDRLLRAAMVGVSKGGAKLEDEPTSDDAPAAANDDPVKSSTAYEKQSDAADQEADGAGPRVDKEL